jgi:V8-like Glu-specific endopeptidase
LDSTTDAECGSHHAALRATPKPRLTAPVPPSGPVVKSPGAPPRLKDTAGLAVELPGLAATPKEQSGVEPYLTSSAGYFFTTHRVTTPISNGYPYITGGQLFFHDPRTGGNFVCTASVIRQRLLSTAGHCVAHASTSSSSRYFYNNFLFVPALDGGSAPLLLWSWAYAITTNTWYLSDGSVPNAADYALIEVRDAVVGTQIRKIWFFTGYLGYFTGGLAPNHITALGYPCNLDRCERMQRNDAQSFSAENNTAVIGSAMRGGASGGPWIQDFGVTPSSSPFVSGLGANYQRGNTSYGPVSTTPKYLGASFWDSRWVSIKNTACAHRAGNCSN